MSADTVLSAMEGGRERCLHATMSDYVTKLIKSAGLDAAIDRGLGLEDSLLLQAMSSSLLGEWEELLARIADDLAGRDVPKNFLDACSLKGLLAICTASVPGVRCSISSGWCVRRRVGSVARRLPIP